MTVLIGDKNPRHVPSRRALAKLLGYSETGESREDGISRLKYAMELALGLRESSTRHLLNGPAVQGANLALATKSPRNLSLGISASSRMLEWEKPDWLVPTSYEVRAADNRNVDLDDAEVVAATLALLRYEDRNLDRRKYWVVPLVAFGRAQPATVVLGLPPRPRLPNVETEVCPPDRGVGVTSNPLIGPDGRPVIGPDNRPIIVVGIPDQTLEVVSDRLPMLVQPFGKMTLEVRADRFPRVVDPIPDAVLEVHPPDRNPLVFPVPDSEVPVQDDRPPMLVDAIPDMMVEQMPPDRNLFQVDPREAA